MTTTKGATATHGRFVRPRSATWERIRSTFTMGRFLTSLVVALAIGIPLAFTVKEKTAPPVPIDSAIDSVFPDANDLDLRQVDVGIDLRNTYQFIDLSIDNYPIPEDQLTIVTALNQYSFQAGDSKDITQFTPGRHCATATFKPLNGTDADVRSRSWCFVLH